MLNGCEGAWQQLAAISKDLDRQRARYAMECRDARDLVERADQADLHAEALEVLGDRYAMC
jgi:hypothetical protein